MRLLFSSIHSYLDPSSGAALATRELLELLTARGMDCRALCTGVLDYERETTLDEVLASLELPASRFQAELTGGRSAEVMERFAEPPQAGDSPSGRRGAGNVGCAGPAADGPFRG